MSYIDNSSRTAQVVKQFKQAARTNNFEFDAQGVLQQYLTDVGLSGPGSEDKEGDFNGAALVIQAYTELYSKRVDNLHKTGVNMAKKIKEDEEQARAMATLEDFVLIDEPPCHNVRRRRHQKSKAPVRLPPLMVDPPVNTAGSLQLYSYDGESLGPLSSFNVMSTLQHGMLTDSLAPLDDETRPHHLRRSETVTESTLDIADPNAPDTQADVSPSLLVSDSAMMPPQAD